MLHGAPPPEARWLDLIADGTHRLVRIDLDRLGETITVLSAAGAIAAGGLRPFRLRVTPPLGGRPEEIEVVVTGRRSRARAVVPVGREMPDT